VADQTPRFSSRLRGLPPEVQGLRCVRRARSYSPTRTSSRHPTIHSESPRQSNRNSLEEGDPPLRDDFDPPIVEYYYSEDESP